MTDKNIHKRLQLIKDEKKIKSIREFALSLNVDPSFFTKIFKGEEEITEKIIEKLESVYGLNREWIEFGTTPKYNPKQIESKSNGHDFPVYTEKYITLLEKQNETSLTELKELLVATREMLTINQALIGAIYKHLNVDKDKDVQDGLKKALNRDT